MSIGLGFFLLLLQTGGALLCSVDTDSSSNAFLVCVVGSRDRSVPFGPGRACVFIARETPSFEVLQSPDRACEFSCVRGESKSLLGT